MQYDALDNVNGMSLPCIAFPPNAPLSVLEGPYCPAGSVEFDG